MAYEIDDGDMSYMVGVREKAIEAGQPQKGKRGTECTALACNIRSIARSSFAETRRERRASHFSKILRLST